MILDTFDIIDAIMAVDAFVHTDTVDEHMFRRFRNQSVVATKLTFEFVFVGGRAVHMIHKVVHDIGDFDTICKSVRLLIIIVLDWQQKLKFFFSNTYLPYISADEYFLCATFR